MPSVTKVTLGHFDHVECQPVQQVSTDP